MEDQHRSLWFVSVQDEWDITGKLTFTGGVRLDEYSDFGTTINPRAALVWESSYYLTTKLLYGRAFRAPSFSEQFVQNNPVVAGNPDVDPETIDTYELVFDLQPASNLNSVVNFFFYQAENMIDFVGPEPIPTAQNFGEQEGYGFEIEVSWEVTDRFNMNTNLSYQHSENKKTGSRTPDVPVWQLYLNPHWKFARDWSLDAHYYWVGEQYRAQGDPREKIDDYGLVNLTLRRKNILGNLEAALAVRNLFDEDGRTPSPYNPNAPQGAYIPNDYPIEGISFWGELRWRI